MSHSYWQRGARALADRSTSQRRAQRTPERYRAATERLARYFQAYSSSYSNERNGGSLSFAAGTAVPGAICHRRRRSEFVRARSSSATPCKKARRRCVAPSTHPHEVECRLPDRNHVNQLASCLKRATAPQRYVYNILARGAVSPSDASVREARSTRSLITRSPAFRSKSFSQNRHHRRFWTKAASRAK